MRNCIPGGDPNSPNYRILEFGPEYFPSIRALVTAGRGAGARLADALVRRELLPPDVSTLFSKAETVRKKGKPPVSEVRFSHVSAWSLEWFDPGPIVLPLSATEFAEMARIAILAASTDQG